MSTNYMLATWSGNREQPKEERGRWYIKDHLDHLNSLQHNLDQVTIGWPYNPNEDPAYTEYMNSLTELKSGTPIHFVRTPNKGRSYGQYSHIFEKYNSQFDYYILMEDDYVPVLDNFDQELISMLEEKGCDYLCDACGDMPKTHQKRKGKRTNTIVTYHKGAAISNGICHCRSLEKVRSRYGELLHSQGNGQRMFSEGFLNSGCTIADHLDKYSAWFCQHHPKHTFRIYGDESLPPIIVPIQYLWDDGSTPRQVIKDAR